MMFTWKWFTNALVRGLPQILNVMSPAIRKDLEVAIEDVYKRALDSENPFDDFGIKLLGDALGIELEEPE